MGLTNNDIFKKLRVAHKLRDEEIVEICKLVDFEVSKSEIGAIFRNENHKNYMKCFNPIVWILKFYSHAAIGGIDINIASVFPPVSNPNFVPRS